MTIPPTDDSKPAPGDAFFQELYPVLDICEKGQCHWAVESSLIKVVRTSEGAEAEIRFRNPGSRSIGLVFDGVSRSIPKWRNYPYDGPALFLCHRRLTLWFNRE
jgi:hypothetical protein